MLSSSVSHYYVRGGSVSLPLLDSDGIGCFREQLEGEGYLLLTVEERGGKSFFPPISHLTSSPLPPSCVVQVLKYARDWREKVMDGH